MQRSVWMAQLLCWTQLMWSMSGLVVSLSAALDRHNIGCTDTSDVLIETVKHHP